MLEYRVVDRESDGLLYGDVLGEVLNDFAADGWGLCELQVYPVSRTRATGDLCVRYQFFLRREKPAPKPAAAARRGGNTHSGQ